jgi:hypothetical protein
MKKKTTKTQANDMLPEYDLEGKIGVRGKYFRDMQKGYSVRVLKQDGTIDTKHFVPKEDAILLDKDVRAHFPDSKSVNNALRILIRQTRKQAKEAGLKKSDIKSAVLKARGHKKLK